VVPLDISFSENPIITYKKRTIHPEDAFEDVSKAGV
jgi:hypothetical protein